MVDIVSLRPVNKVLRFKKDVIRARSDFPLKALYMKDINEIHVVFKQGTLMAFGVRDGELSDNVHVQILAEGGINKATVIH